ncbi:MAG TPA: hemolysin III family protein [Burkholderiaceae bacterium]|nr:hemolysin III family protein [Burkholderiaceae bacterium]
MNKPLDLLSSCLGEPRAQTLGEEIANAVSHGLGVLLAATALPILLVGCARRDAASADYVAASVFGATMLLLYCVSALYHALPLGRAKALFNRLDHAAIYLFIAGSYTPFALGALGGELGWALFGVVWSIALLGSTAKLLNRLAHPLWSTSLYLAMGWLVVFAADPLIAHVSTVGLSLLLAGGLAYTLGAALFLLDSALPYAHFAWHLFVLGGSVCHGLAALWYAR